MKIVDTFARATPVKDPSKFCVGACVQLAVIPDVLRLASSIFDATVVRLAAGACSAASMAASTAAWSFCCAPMLRP